MGIEDSAVRDNPAEQRFEMDTSAGPAVANYRWDGDLLVIFHTEVPRELRGRGMGDKLVRSVLDEARRRKLKVVPRCWFVREFVDRNPEYRDVMVTG
jgi:predicted GNAT family acetyltransferase